MISKQQFTFLIEGLKEQSEFEDKFNECFSMLNSSYTVVELSVKLSTNVFEALEEDFTDIGIDIICDYLYGNETNFSWTEGQIEDIDYNYKITSNGDLYDMLDKHFRY